MATAVAGTPHPDAVGVDLRTGLRVGNRMAIVAHLRPWVDLLARLAVAGAKVPVVKHQRSQPPAANASAKLSRYISFTAEKPCAMTTVATGPVAPSGRYSQPRRVTPSASNSMSCRIAIPFHQGPDCKV